MMMVLWEGQVLVLLYRMLLLMIGLMQQRIGIAWLEALSRVVVLRICWLAVNTGLVMGFCRLQMGRLVCMHTGLDKETGLLPLVLLLLQDLV